MRDNTSLFGGGRSSKGSSLLLGLGPFLYLTAGRIRHMLQQSGTRTDVRQPATRQGGVPAATLGSGIKDQASAVLGGKGN